MMRIWNFFTGLVKRKPSQEVKELEAHLKRAEFDDVKLRAQTIRKERLIRDNHLVADVERALGLRP